MKTTLQLTTWDRIMVGVIVGAKDGDAKFMRKATKILQAMEFNDGERDSIGMKSVDQGGGTFNVTWNDEGDAPKIWEVELNDPDALVLLKDVVKSHTWKGSQHKQAIPLFDRLGITE
jgi:hypothetical protein